MAELTLADVGIKEAKKRRPTKKSKRRFNPLLVDLRTSELPVCKFLAPHCGAFERTAQNVADRVNYLRRNASACDKDEAMSALFVECLELASRIDEERIGEQHAGLYLLRYGRLRAITNLLGGRSLQDKWWLSVGSVAECIVASKEIEDSHGFEEFMSALDEFDYWVVDNLIKGHTGVEIARAAVEAKGGIYYPSSWTKLMSRFVRRNMDKLRKLLGCTSSELYEIAARTAPISKGVIDDA